MKLGVSLSCSAAEWGVAVAMGHVLSGLKETACTRPVRCRVAVRAASTAPPDAVPITACNQMLRTWKPTPLPCLNLPSS